MGRSEANSERVKRQTKNSETQIQIFANFELEVVYAVLDKLTKAKAKRKEEADIPDKK
jgi:hypothetical protein